MGNLSLPLKQQMETINYLNKLLWKLGALSCTIFSRWFGRHWLGSRKSQSSLPQHGPALENLLAASVVRFCFQMGFCREFNVLLTQYSLLKLESFAVSRHACPAILWLQPVVSDARLKILTFMCNCCRHRDYERKPITWEVSICQKFVLN